MRHGIDCREAEHRGRGYLHEEYDNSPFDVDGVWYCGRCHCALSLSELAIAIEATASARIAAEAEKDGTGSEVVE